MSDHDNIRRDISRELIEEISRRREQCLAAGNQVAADWWYGFAAFVYLQLEGETGDGDDPDDPVLDLSEQTSSIRDLFKHTKYRYFVDV